MGFLVLWFLIGFCGKNVEQERRGREEDKVGCLLSWLPPAWLPIRLVCPSTKGHISPSMPPSSPCSDNHHLPSSLPAKWWEQLCSSTRSNFLLPCGFPYPNLKALSPAATLVDTGHLSIFSFHPHSCKTITRRSLSSFLPPFFWNP